MLTKAQFTALLQQGPILLDGATGSNLMKAGMPRGCCTEKWVLEHPDALIALQRAYAEAGSQILYAPTFQAQPIALERIGLSDQCEKINEQLVQLSRSVDKNILVAGDITTLAVYCDSFDPENFDLLVENYRRQIHGLIAGGADLLVGETLMYPLEAEAILTAAELEGAPVCMYSFTMQADGSLFSGMDALPVLKELEEAGAFAVGFNCVAADSFTPALVSKMRRVLKGPILCKPNAGVPTIGADNLPHYPMAPAEFAAIITDCTAMGATVIGGCCGTDPDFIKEIKNCV